MGAGKSSFIRAALHHLGVRGAITSPSYSIINHYNDPLALVHGDLYRLGSEEEAEDAGILEAIDHAELSFIEWAVRAPGLFDRAEALAISMEMGTRDEERMVRIEGLTPEEEMTLSQYRGVLGP